jgi:hypothetical protein
MNKKNLNQPEKQEKPEEPEKLELWECYATPENIAELKKKLAMLKRVDGVKR